MTLIFFVRRARQTKKLNRIILFIMSKLSPSDCGIRSFFHAASATEEHTDLYRWIDFLIIGESLPLSACEKQSYRHFSKAQNNFTAKRLRDVILKLTPIVEEKIQEELKNAGRGAIMHDGWTLSGVHYIGLFACYMRNIKSYVEGRKQLTAVPTVTLLSCSPMAKIDDTDTEDTEVATTDTANQMSSQFNAQTHVEHFCEIFTEYYDIALSDWAKAAIADNTTTNRKACRLLGIPHVGCNNHKFNLDIDEWARADNALSTTLDSIGDTMKSAKNSLKNAALLSNLTKLKPVLYNKTRWSGKHDMLQRFIRIRQDLIDVSVHENADIEISDSRQFLRKAEKFQRIMAELNIVTKIMQERCISLSKCRRLLDVTTRLNLEQYDIPGAQFYQSTFVPKRILPDGPLSPNADFESGVVKIQRKKIDDMTDVEKVAVESLLVAEVEEAALANARGSDNDGGILGNIMNDEEEERSDVSSKYGNCDFIYGSCAEVERLWSIAKHILTDVRKGMMDPIMFEAILFLKLNRRLWTLGDVVQADADRLRRDDEDDEDDEDDDDDDDEDEDEDEDE